MLPELRARLKKPSRCRAPLLTVNAIPVACVEHRETKQPSHKTRLQKWKRRIVAADRKPSGDRTVDCNERAKAGTAENLRRSLADNLCSQLDERTSPASLAKEVAPAKCAGKASIQRVSRTWRNDAFEL